MDGTADASKGVEEQGEIKGFNERADTAGEMIAGDKAVEIKPIRVEVRQRNREKTKGLVTATRWR
jgi:hypothetical protein